MSASSFLSRRMLAAGLLLAHVAAAADLTALRKLDYSGDQAAVQALDREIVAAGRDAAQLRTLATQLLGELKQTSLTFAARQAIAQRLGQILATVPDSMPDAALLAPLRRMLLTERDADLVRLAVERAPGPAIDKLFLDALPKSEGKARLSVLQAIGARRLATAVPAVSALLADPNAPTAAVAAYTLGAIGTPEALAALRAAPKASDPAVVAATLAIVPRLSADEATRITTTILNDSQVATSLRTAALRLSLERDAGHAASRTVEVLSGNEWPLKEAAAESIFASQAPGLVPALTAKLAGWDAPTQVAVIAALGRKADPVATPAIVAALASKDAQVRTAAIVALGFLPGTPATVNALAPFAVADDVEPARLARQSLARINGPEVDAAILDGAQHAPANVRAALLDQIAARNMTSALPLLRDMRRADDATVRGAAVTALGEIAPASDQPLVIEWSLQAGDANEQSRALRALVALTQRMPDAATRSQPVIRALEAAPADAAAKCVPVLARLADRASAEAAARLALREDATLAGAATTTLTRWNDRTALAALGTVAEKAPLPANRKSAQQAALRLLERNREPWNRECSQVVSQLMAGSDDARQRTQLVRMLGRAHDETALKLAESLVSDPALEAAAAETVLIIQANRAGPPKFRASGGGNGLRNLMDGKTATRWSVPAEADQWLEIDFGRPRPVSKLTLDESGRTGDFPEKYDVFVTDDPKTPGKAVISGAGRTGQTVIDLPAGTRGRYVIIRSTADRPEGNWSIAELLIE